MARSEEPKVVDENNLKPVLHVLVIGFHHKRGCQVEYAYPPLIPGELMNGHIIFTFIGFNVNLAMNQLNNFF